MEVTLKYYDIKHYNVGSNKITCNSPHHHSSISAYLMTIIWTSDASEMLVYLSIFQKYDRLRMIVKHSNCFLVTLNY